MVKADTGIVREMRYRACFTDGERSIRLQAWQIVSHDEARRSCTLRFFLADPALAVGETGSWPH